MMRRGGWRAVPVAVALAGTLVLAGCGDDSPSAAPQPTVRRATTSTPATTTTAPTTTAAPGQEDWYAILAALLAERDRAYETNDITILERIYTPDCPCLAKARKAIEEQIAEGVHTAGERLKLISVELINRDGPEWVAVRGIVEQPGPVNIVDSSGRVVRPDKTHGPRPIAYELSRRSGTWQIAGINLEGSM